MGEEKLYTLSEARLLIKVEELEQEVERLQAIVCSHEKSISHWQEKAKEYHKEKAVLKYVLDWREEEIEQLKGWVDELLEKSRVAYNRWYYDGIFGIDTKKVFANTIKELKDIAERIKSEREK